VTILDRTSIDRNLDNADRWNAIGARNPNDIPSPFTSAVNSPPMFIQQRMAAAPCVEVCARPPGEYLHGLVQKRTCAAM